MSKQPPTTRIATSSPQDVYIRGRSLCRELIGGLSFTEMIYFQITGRHPTAEQVAVIDGCLVTLMEHGFTPSTISARLVYSSSPDAMQGAVAAGLLAVGSRFVGTAEDCGRLLAEIAAAPDVESTATRIAEEHRAARRPIPGFGHPEHKPDDPRTPALLALGRRHQVAGRHVEALEALSHAVDRALGKHLTVNATGSIAALLADCGVPVEILRGFALIARCAGLVGHIHEEQQTPAMSAMWTAAGSAVPYRPSDVAPKEGTP